MFRHHLILLARDTGVAAAWRCWPRRRLCPLCACSYRCRNHAIRIGYVLPISLSLSCASSCVSRRVENVISARIRPQKRAFAVPVRDQVLELLKQASGTSGLCSAHARTDWGWTRVWEWLGVGGRGGERMLGTSLPHLLFVATKRIGCIRCRCFVQIE